MKAQYNVLMDGIKQTSFQNLQGELDSHMETLSGQVRTHQAQQALSLHKVDMEASVMEVSFRLIQESVYMYVQSIVCEKTKQNKKNIHMFSSSEIEIIHK